MGRAAVDKGGLRYLIAIYLAMLIVAFGYHFFFLSTFDHWWVDDDPYVFNYAGHVANPLRFIADRDVLHHFAAPNTVMSMSAISMWLDSHLAFRSVRMAQIHHAVSLSVVLLLLFLNFRKSGLAAVSAALLVLVWLLLPSTVLVNAFLSARHHLEGLLWSLAAVLVAQKLAAREWRQTAGTLCLLLLFIVLASLSKETYAICLPVFLFLYFWRVRLRRAAWCSIASLPFYFGYRLWAVGLSGHYGAPLLGSREYSEYLLRLPYVLVGNTGGYALLALVALTVLTAAFRREIRLSAAISALAIIVCALAVIYPVAYSLRRDWLEHGTWYRAVFLLDTGIVWAASLLITRTPRRALRYIAVALVLPAVACGGYVTATKWHRMCERYEAEGKFYLEHADRLIYSEVPAYWYLEGVRKMYDVPRRHHVALGDKTLSVTEQLAGFETIWRSSNGRFVADADLFRQLKDQAQPTP